jgi:hypothetical protein
MRGASWRGSFDRGIFRFFWRMRQNRGSQIAKKQTERKAGGPGYLVPVVSFGGLGEINRAVNSSIKEF